MGGVNGGGGGGLNFLVGINGSYQQVTGFCLCIVHVLSQGPTIFYLILRVLMGIFNDKIVTALSNSIVESYFQKYS